MTQRKDGIWQQAMTVIVDGRRVQKYFYGKTKADVLRKIQDYKDEQASGPTFGAVADEWWEHHEPTLATNTTKSYKPALARAKEQFGSRRIRQILPTEINQFLKAFIKEKSAAKKTATTQRMVINLIFKYAVKNGYAIVNPAREISLPRNLSSKERELPEDDQIKLVKEHTDAPFGMFAYWALYTGCRRGELQALTWEDVDLENGWIHITKTLYYKNGKPAIKPPKTKKGIRDIPLLDKLAEKLEPGKGLIFANESGGYLTEWQFQKSWADYKEASGVTCTAHQLRHVFTTMLFENQIEPKDIQAIVGHAQLSTTMDIYTHIRKVQADRVKAKVSGLDIT